MGHTHTRLELLLAHSHLGYPAPGTHGAHCELVVVEAAVADDHSTLRRMLGVAERGAVDIQGIPRTFEVEVVREVAEVHTTDDEKDGVKVDVHSVYENTDRMWEGAGPPIPEAAGKKGV